MKTHFKEIAVFTFASVLSTTLIVACGQTKAVPAKTSRISINAMNKDAQQDPQNSQDARGTQNSQAQNFPNLRFTVDVSDKKPMLAIMQTALGDKMDSYMSDDSVQENIALDLTLANLDGSDVIAAASGATSPGAGSSLYLKTTLNNSSNQPLVMQMESHTVIIDIKDTKLTAVFTVMPESKMRTDMMTVTLDGSIATAPLSSVKTYSGTISITDSSNNKSQIGNFSLPLAKIMSDKDAAALSGTATTATASDDSSSSSPAKSDDNK